jgi:hypothetical protein
MSELDHLNELVRELADCAGSQCALLLEHLESARFYLSGAMPLEYRMSLLMARNQLKCVPNEGFRAQLADFIQSQLQDHRPILK